MTITQRLRQVTQTPTQGIYTYQVIDGPLNVRKQPSIQDTPFLTIAEGYTFVVDYYEQEAIIDSYIWVKHERGWSAIAKSDGSENYAVILSDKNVHHRGRTEQDPDAPNYLPNLGNLFIRLPVDLDKVSWVQYYGNTWFAYNLGHNYNYHRYSQGFHPGFDFGNLSRTLTIYAGLHGKVIYKNKNEIHIQTDNYVVAYQHLHQVKPISIDSSVEPDTILGYTDPLDFHSNHLHVEIRYNRWLVNPLILMRRQLVDKILEAFDPIKNNSFVYTMSWNKWTEPLDQPIIKTWGSIIGPKTLRR